MRITINASEIMESLKKLREASGMSQQEVGNRAGRTQSWVAKMERLDVDHKLGSYCLYAKALGYELQMDLQTIIKPCA